MKSPDFRDTISSEQPFPHFRVPKVLGSELADRALEWLTARAVWRLRIESFYEQHEISLLAAPRDRAVAELTSPDLIGAIRRELSERLGPSGDLELVDVSAHLLTAGQTIRIHNDYLNGEETHRFLIQLNQGWKAEQGGLLMLFASNTPESVTNIIVPTHGSGFGFQISAESFHAVSSIKSGDRYTLVYTFREQQPDQR